MHTLHCQRLSVMHRPVGGAAPGYTRHGVEYRVSAVLIVSACTDTPDSLVSAVVKSSYSTVTVERLNFKKKQKNMRHGVH